MRGVSPKSNVVLAQQVGVSHSVVILSVELDYIPC